MQACSLGYEQLVVFFSKPVNMDCKDNHEETQRVTSEINMGTDFHLKKAQTEVRRLLLCWQYKQKIKLLEHSPMWDRSSTKRQQTFKQRKIMKRQELLHTFPYSW